MGDMQKPLHHRFFFWLGPVVFVLLGLLKVDTHFIETNLRIPRGEEKVPLYFYAESGLLHLDIEQTPDPHADRTFAFRRSMIRDRQFRFLRPQLYEKNESYKYHGKTWQERRAAQLAGIRSPLLRHELSLPIWMLMTIVGWWWWISVRRRSRRMMREEMAGKAVEM